MRRYIILAASCIISLCIGSGFTWSVNQSGFIEESAMVFGRMVSVTSIAMTFTIYTGVSSLSMVLTGTLAKHYGAKPLLIVSSFLFCLGVFLAGFANSLFMLYVTYGVMGGVGGSAIFTVVLKNLIPFFSDKTGMATGMMTAAYGLSALVFAPVMQKLIEYGGVLFNLRMMGLIFALIMSISIVFVKQYPESKEFLMNQKKYPVMLKDKKFPLLFITYTGFATCGLMFISQGGAMGMVIGEINNTAVLVMLLSLANVAGRVVWGLISDRTSRHTVIISTAVLIATNGLVLGILGSSIAAFLICSMVILFCYGGCMGVFPALLSDLYGARNSALNYGIIGIGYSLGGYIGPIMATRQYAAIGAYTSVFFLVCITGAIAAVCMGVLIRLDVK